MVPGKNGCFHTRLKHRGGHQVNVVLAGTRDEGLAP